jgi:oligopeptide transport system ATP-binding protein
MKNEESAVAGAPILELRNLRTSFKTDAGVVQAARGVTLSVERGESVGIVGESGSGKTVSMLSTLRLLPPQAVIEAESLDFDGIDILHADSRVMRSIAGKEIGFIFQDPMTSLNPLLTVGDQLAESMKIHLGIRGKTARQRAIEILRTVEIPEPEARLKQYPFEFSGGMRQRVMIAIAIACKPKLVIADEPTTALDVTIQAQILDLLKGLKDMLQTSIVLISHDMGVIASMCTKVFVMYGGRVVESGLVDEIFYESQHPYTTGLLCSIPEQGEGPRRKLVPIPGSPPDLIAPPKGCAFAARCAKAMRVCALAQPPITRLSSTHEAECWLLDPRAAKSGRAAAREGAAK